MDSTTVEINNLRVLNDFLNQTLAALCRVQSAGVVGTVGLTGLAHSPFVGNFGIPGVAPSLMLANTSALAQNPVFAGQFAADPMFFAQRMLSHGMPTFGSSLSTLGPLAGIARQLENVWAQRAWGVPF